LLVQFVGKCLHLLFADRSFDVFGLADELLPGLRIAIPFVVCCSRSVGEKEPIQDVYRATTADASMLDRHHTIPAPTPPATPAKPSTSP